MPQIEDELQVIADYLDQTWPDSTDYSAKNFSLFDQMHLGGAAITYHLIDMIKPHLNINMHFLDLGSGRGGPARMLYEQIKLYIRGLDKDSYNVQIATFLSQKLGVAAHVSFARGDILATHLGDQSIDGAWCLHVGMFIEDKGAMLKELVRVLKPGGFFLIYDPMLNPGQSVPAFPVPWAKEAAESHIIQEDDFEKIMSDFPLKKLDSRDFTEIVRKWSEKTLPSFSKLPDDIKRLRGADFLAQAENVDLALQKQAISVKAHLFQKLI